MQRRRERGSQLEHGKSDDVYHQCRPSSVTICDRSEEQGAHRPHCERQENCFEYGGNLRVELRGNGADAESQNEKIECIQRPPEETGDERVALHCREAPRMSQKLDDLLPGINSSAYQ